MIEMHRLRPPRVGCCAEAMGIPADGSDVSTEFLSWGSTPFESIADAQAMDRQYDGSWGIDLVGYGRLAAVAKDVHA